MGYDDDSRVYGLVAQVCVPFKTVLVTGSSIPLPI